MNRESATTNCSSSFRIVEHRRDNAVSGESVIRFRAQEKVRAWWKLFFGWTWMTIEYEAGLPGYYFPYEFDSKEEAIEKIEEIRTYRRWSSPRKTVIDVR